MANNILYARHACGAYDTPCSDLVRRTRAGIAIESAGFRWRGNQGGNARTIRYYRICAATVDAIVADLRTLADHDAGCREVAAYPPDSEYCRAHGWHVMATIEAVERMYQMQPYRVRRTGYAA